MEWDKLVDLAIEYFEDHDEEYIVTIEDLDSWSGILDYHRYRSMYDSNYYFEGRTPTEIIESVNSYFNTNDEYFYEDSWGEIYSSNEIDYSDYLEEDFITDLYDHRDRIELPTYIEKLFNAYDNGEEDDEEDEI